MPVPPLWNHQQQTRDKAALCPGFCDWSDPGTGKSRSHLQGFADAGGRMLIMATKSTLQSAWGNDIDTFFPGMTYAIATAQNRERAMKAKVDVVITNHDAAAWLLKYKPIVKSFNRLVIDESTAFKNPSAQRSKAMKTLAKEFAWRRALTGTPNPNTILDIWHQVLLCDDGQRLGSSFWKFRNVACEPVQVGPKAEHLEWRDKPGIEMAVFDLLSDISIRHIFEECVSIPENSVRRIEFELSDKCGKAYEEMVEHSIFETDGREIDAVNAASVATKLSQIASGAVYSGEGDYVVLDDTRTELILDLIEERKHSLVAFNWKHQKDALVEGAKKRGYAFGVLDGEAKDHERNQVVTDFQAGKLKVVFAHPRSAGHGLTLTKGTATIWASPTWSSELYKQFNARIYRAGQTERTETILVCAKGTIDERVYEGLSKKLSAMELLLELMEAA